MLLPPAPAYAQEGDEPEIEEIIVTGSRIRRIGIDPTRPILSIGQETFDRSAFTNIADALNEIPAFGGGIDPDGAQNAFTVGQNYVDLFDLGTQRTLTLVNGKRFVSSNPPTFFGSQSGLQVDLNSIPAALVDRVEIVPMGGGAIYGSDAIAGTVNVFLRDDYEGFEISGVREQTGEGDGDAYQMQMVAGFNFDDGRGNLTMSLESNRQDGVAEVDRDFLIDGELAYEATGRRDLDGDGMNDDIDGDGNPENFRTMFADQIVQVVGGGGGGITPTSSTFFAPAHSDRLGQLEDGKFYQFQGGNLVECHPAAGYGTIVRVYDSSPNACGVHDFFAESGQVRSPLERSILTTNLTYDITDNITYFQSIIVSTSEATELRNQGGFQTGFFSGESDALTVQATHPFISQQARDILAANNLTEFKLHRYNNDLVNHGQDNTTNLVARGEFALNGQFDWRDRTMFWDFTTVVGRSKVDTEGSGIIDGRFFNAVDAVRLNATTLQPIIGALSAMEDGDGDLNGDGEVNMADALQRVATTGGSGVDVIRTPNPVVCQISLLHAQNGLMDADGNELPGPTDYNSPAAGGGLTDRNLPFSDGCVPLNLFTYGGSSPEALGFITGGPQYGRSDFDQRVFMANLSGDLFDLPAGPFAFAVGWENRTDDGEFRSGLDSAVPITRSSAIAASGGKLEANEFFGELRVPLISPEMNVPLLHEAEFTLAARRVVNTIGDDEADAETTNEFRMSVSPTEWLTLRASTASAIRTPSLVELYNPRSQFFVAGDDPCDAREITGGDAPATRRANCLAHMASLGVTDYDPATFRSNIQDGTIDGGFSSGNALLVPEIAESWSAGFSLEPVDDLVIAFDWLNIEIEERIENFDWEALGAACYDNPVFPGNQFCDQFTRDEGTGQISEVNSTWLNSAESRWVGSQLQAEYEVDLWDAGELEWDLYVLYVRTDESQNTPTSPVTDTSGGYFIPDWQGTFDTTYTYDDKWRVFWRVLFQDEPKLDPNGDVFYLNRAENRVVHKTRHPILHNMSVRYNITENFSLQLTVRNVEDRKPNSVENAIGYFGAAEELGRSFSLSTRYRFR